ncbi:MAG: hypothetical protein WC523_06830 [Patescibacteria group bacterium]|jgi:acyl carrier protein
MRNYTDKEIAQEVKAAILKEMSETLTDEDLVPEASLIDLELRDKGSIHHILHLIDIIIDLEDSFSIEIDEGELLRLWKLQDIFDLIRKKIPRSE